MEKSTFKVVVILLAFLAGAIVESEVGILSRFTHTIAKVQVPTVLSVSNLFFQNERTVEIPALPEFVFKENITDYPGITRMINGPWTPHLWGKDYRQFIEIVEAPKGASVLQYKTLGPRPASFAKVLDDLGGEKKAVVSFSQIYYLIEKQKDGQEGPLLIPDFVNGVRPNANIFFVKNNRGVVFPARVSATRDKESIFKPRWSIDLELYGERQRRLDSQGIPFKYDEVIPGDVLFYLAS